MKRENHASARLIVLYEIIKSARGEEDALTTQEIVKKIKEQNNKLGMNFGCDRRTIQRDVKVLQLLGYSDIQSISKGKSNAYYVIDSSSVLSEGELKLLIDAVHASRFISEKTTMSLIDKIASLAGHNKGMLLSRSVTQFFASKHENKQVQYNIERITDALIGVKQNDGKTIFPQVKFVYFKLDENGKQKEIGTYITNPLFLKYADEYYYLVGIRTDRNEIDVYRVDRMKNVNIVKKNGDFLPITINREDELQKIDHNYGKAVFNMYLEEAENVTILVERQFINAVFDRFGEDIKFKKLAYGCFETTVYVVPDPGFWAWLNHFQGGVRILKPDSVRQNFVKYMKDTLDKYNSTI